MRRISSPRAHVCFATFAAAALVSCGGGSGGGAATSPYGDTGGTGGPSQAIASVAITGNVTTLAVGSTVTLTAAAYNATGGVVPATFTWASSNTAVATVGASSGVVTGVAAGTTTITASAGGFTGSRVLSVTSGSNQPAPLVAQIAMPGTAFEPNAVTIGVGGTVTWVFSAITHNVTFTSGPGAPDNIPNTSNQTVSRTFNTAGTYNFSCTIHYGMDGVITVR